MEIRNKFVGNYKTIGEETSEKISQYLSTRTTSDAAPRKHCSWENKWRAEGSDTG